MGYGGGERVKLSLISENPWMHESIVRNRRKSVKHGHDSYHKSVYGFM